MELRVFSSLLQQWKVMKMMLLPKETSIKDVLIDVVLKVI